MVPDKCQHLKCATCQHTTRSTITAHVGVVTDHFLLEGRCEYEGIVARPCPQALVAIQYLHCPNGSRLHHDKHPSPSRCPKKLFSYNSLNGCHQELKPWLLLFTSSPVIQVIHSIPWLKFISLTIHRSWDPRYRAGLVADPRPPLEKLDPKHVQWLSSKKSTSVAVRVNAPADAPVQLVLKSYPALADTLRTQLASKSIFCHQEK